MILPCSTTRSRRRDRAELGSARRATPSASSPPCPRAARPRASSSEPVHTDVVHVLSASIARIQSSVGFVLLERARREAAGHDEDVGARDLVDARSRRRAPSNLLSVRIAPALAWRRTSRPRPGRRCSTSYGPIDVERGDAVEDEAGDVHGCSSLVASWTPGPGGSDLGTRRGLAPTRRANARRMRLDACRSRRRGRSSSTARPVVSSRRRATSTRTVSTYAAGVHPTSSRNTRAKWRGLIATRAASRSTRVVVVGMLDDPRLQLAERIALGDLRAELRAELRLPARPLHEHHELARGHAARRRGRDRRRRARARGPCPRSRRPTSTRCRRARRSGRGRRSTSGYMRGEQSSHARQCVVARRPSSTPAAASRNAPVHTDATRRLRARGALRPSATSVASRAASSAPSPPTTTSVSIGPRTDASDGRPRSRPRVVGPRPGSMIATSTRYASAIAARPSRDLGRGREHLVRADEVEGGDARVGDEDDAAAHRPIVRPTAAWQQ